MGSGADGRLPTFVVAGAPRCGTTSLHYYLGQHPQVGMSAIKEPNFFLFDSDGTPSIDEEDIVRKSVRKLAEYKALFHPEPGQTAFGDVSPLYLYTREAPDRIKEQCGDVPVICLLRHPAERAWSHFLHAFADAQDALGEFSDLVEREIAHGPGYSRYRTSTHLLRLGRYAEQIERYHDVFGEDRVLALLIDDLEDEPSETLDRVCRFIDVETGQPLGEAKRYNVSGVASGALLVRARRAARRVQPRVKAMLPPKLAGRLGRLRAVVEDSALRPVALPEGPVRDRLSEWYAPDVERVAALVGRDLSAWLR
jgi:hypothetical protein